MSTDAMTADQILALRVHDARHVFGEHSEQVFKRLVKRWHPDVSPDPRADEVLRHLLFLRRSSANGTSAIAVIGATGEDHLDLSPFAETDTGRRWVGPGLIAWSFEREPDLAEVFVRNLRALPFADKAMREQMRDVFPKRIREVTYDDAPMIIFPRQRSAILADWIAAHGPLPAVHAAWLGSGLLNVAAWTTWSRWTLPGIGLDTVAIDPATHKVFVFAGWEAAAVRGKRPVVASRRTLSLCPALSAPGHTPPSTLTLDVVRRTLREALGDPSGLTLKDLDVPGPMADWINGPSLPDGRMEYHSWYRALERAFGARRFVEWGKEVAEVYPNH